MVVGVMFFQTHLQDLSHALQPHARVYVLGGEGLQLAAGVAVHLHEYQVVELDEPESVGVMWREGGRRVG